MPLSSLVRQYIRIRTIYIDHIAYATKCIILNINILFILFDNYLKSCVCVFLYYTIKWQRIASVWGKFGVFIEFMLFKIIYKIFISDSKLTVMSIFNVARCQSTRNCNGLIIAFLLSTRTKRNLIYLFIFLGSIWTSNNSRLEYGKL